MNIILIQELLVITNSFIHKYLTVEESFAVEDLNYKLLKARGIYVKHREKLIAGFGGQSDGMGGYKNIKNQTELTKAILESEKMDIEFKYNTHIVSIDSFNTSKRFLDINTVQIRTAKEHLLIPEKNELLSEKYKNKPKPK